MNTILENDYLQIAINAKGAELCSVINKQNGLQYIWGGDPLIWGKTSPILFPIVGTLKENSFYYNHKQYTLPRHGFARDHTFDVSNVTREAATFTLRSQPAFLSQYPFNFELRLNYSLKQAGVNVQYEVINHDEKEMFFSLGAHPAFKVPLTPSSTYTDYYLLFDQVENAGRWPITNEGLLSRTPTALLDHTNRLDLDKSLFENDALVFKNLRSEKVSLRCNKHDHGLDFHFAGFPFMGLWAAKNADFLCIEPWCGVADSVGHNQQLQHKEGIEKLSPGNTWSRNWTVDVY